MPSDNYYADENGKLKVALRANESDAWANAYMKGLKPGERVDLRVVNGERSNIADPRPQETTVRVIGEPEIDGTIEASSGGSDEEEQ